MNLWLISLLILWQTHLLYASNESRIEFHESRDLTLLLGEKTTIELQVIEDPEKHELNRFNYKLGLARTKGIAHPFELHFPKNSTRVYLEIKAISPISQSNLAVTSCKFDDSDERFDEDNAKDCKNSLKESFIRLTVLKSYLVDILCIVVGWTYFVLWSASFYPQVWLNYKRKSVIGMDFNYVFLNVVANGSYTIFNCLMYFNREVQAEYLEGQPYAPLPVLLNDVVFAAHALTFSLVYALQACFYERGTQRLHPVLWIGGVLYLFASISVTALCLMGGITELQLANIFSYVKIVVTTPMYLPQLYYNFCRKSTQGFAIETIMLDFSGGLLSLLQMVLQAWNVDDWSGFIGNPVKFGLALITMVLDMVFFVQHFVLYRNAREEPNKT